MGSKDWEFHPTPLKDDNIWGGERGHVVGAVKEEDLWQILVATTMWLNNYPDNTEDDYHGYFHGVNADTDFLYDQLQHPSFQPDGVRVVHGALATVDELGWLGFTAHFYADNLMVLVTEVDTNWAQWIHAEEQYGYREDTRRTEYLGLKYHYSYDKEA